MLDEFEREEADGDHALVLDDDPLVDLGEGTLPQKVALPVLVLPVLERLHRMQE